jgi:8-oxo-dGTP pyrophosphatase MutT (NUDIX family)
LSGKDGERAEVFDRENHAARLEPRGAVIESHGLRVVVAVIQRGGLLLIAQRPAHKRHGGLWEFPAGTMESDETRLQARNENSLKSWPL